MPSRINRADIVHVQGSDLRMRLARVVDVTGDGLFVDLLCANRRREFAPFGSVFFPTRMPPRDQCLYYTQKQPTVPVEILMPETPSGPWIWLAGQMSGRESGVLRHLYTEEGAVVHWRSLDGGAACTDLVRIDRIRPMLNTENQPFLRECVRSGGFIKHCVDLGEEFSLLSTDKAQALCRQGCVRVPYYFAVFAVDLADGQLRYIHQPRYLYRYRGYVLSAGFNRWWTNDNNSIPKLLIFLVQKPHHEDPISDEDKTSGALLAELWQEVFSHLDTVDQTMLRAVCVTWNRILITPALRSTLVFHSALATRRKYNDFLQMATVYKCLRPDTQRLAITHLKKGNRNNIFEVKNLCGMIQYVAGQQSGIRLRTVYLHRFEQDIVPRCPFWPRIRLHCQMWQSAVRCHPHRQPRIHLRVSHQARCGGKDVDTADTHRCSCHAVSALYWYRLRILRCVGGGVADAPWEHGVQADPAAKSRSETEHDGHCERRCLSATVRAAVR